MVIKLPYTLYRVFTDLSNDLIGNTSPVFVLDKELSTDQMQSIATDLWQPASTFLWKNNDKWQVRWFAPDQEIGLCGHGSLCAIAHLGLNDPKLIKFYANETEISGGLLDDQSGFLNLSPIHVTKQISNNNHLEAALGIPVIAHYQTNNKHIVLTDTESSVKAMKPNFEKLRESPVFGYAVTAPGENADFVSRTLVPHVHQLEDPATGSSHSALAPFWSERLSQSKMIAYQLSKRGGKFGITYEHKMVRLEGEYQAIGEGTFNLK